MEVYELYGLSGSGKTTMVNNVKKMLVNDGFSVLLMNEIFYSEYNNIKSLIKAIVDDYPFAVSCSHFVFNYGVNLHNIKCFARIIIMKYITKYYDDKYDYMLIDEGILQFSQVAGKNSIKKQFYNRQISK